MNESGGSRKTVGVMAISLLGKMITLLGRTMYMAVFGGSNPLLNVYNYALDIPNVVFNCVGTALNTVIIPIYTALLAKGSSNQAKKFLDDIITIAMTIITVLVGIGIVAAPLISLVAKGNVQEEYRQYLIFAIRVLMPVMIFYGLNYIFQGILQSHGRFKLPAAVSAPSGIIIILYIVFFADRWGVTGLIFATVVSLFAQPAIMVGAVRKLGYRYKFSFDYKDPHIKTAGALTMPVLASVSSYQLNFLFNNTMALRFGTVSLMTYSQLLVQTFMLTIVYAITSVYFPRLSVLWASERRGDFAQTLKEILEYTLFLILPAAFGFWLLRFDIMDFLLNWRGQEANDAVLAGNLLGLYSIGIIAISLKEVLDRAFYSFKDTKTPAIFGFVIMAVNIAATMILLDTLGPYSMPVAYCISAFCGSLGLLFRVNGRAKVIDRVFLLSVGKILLAAAVMLLASGYAMRLIDGIYLINSVITKLIGLAVPAAAGAVVYVGLAYVLKIPAFVALLKRGANR